MNYQYRLEIFDQSTLTGKSFALVENPEIKMDILTFEKTSFKCKEIDTVMGDFVKCYDETGAMIYDGIISSIETEKNVSTVYCVPMLSLLDVQASPNMMRTGQSISLQAEISQQLVWAYNWNLGLLDYVEVGKDETQDVVTIPEYSTIYDLMYYGMQNTGLFINVSLSSTQNKIVFEYAHRATTEKIEGDLECVLESSFKFGDINKVNSVSFSGYATSDVYALYEDGTVCDVSNPTTQANRVKPSVWAYSERPDGDMLAEAKAIIGNEKYLNEVELTYKKDAKVLPTLPVVNKAWAEHPKLALGTVCSLVHDGKEYASMLTGYHMTGEKITFLFGNIRTELTKQISQLKGEAKTSSSTITDGVITSATAGTFDIAKQYKNGSVVTVYVKYSKSAQTVSGGNACTATFAGELPPYDVETFGYYGNFVFGLRIEPNGNLTIRNASPEAATAPAGVFFSTTYLI